MENPLELFSTFEHFSHTISFSDMDIKPDYSNVSFTYSLNGPLFIYNTCYSIMSLGDIQYIKFVSTPLFQKLLKETTLEIENLFTSLLDNDDPRIYEVIEDSRLQYILDEAGMPEKYKNQLKIKESTMNSNKKTILTSIAHTSEMSIDSLLKDNKFKNTKLWFSMSNNSYMLDVKRTVDSVVAIHFYILINQVEYIEKISKEFFDKILNDFKREITKLMQFDAKHIFLRHPMTKYLISKLSEEDQLYMKVEYDI